LIVMDKVILIPLSALRASLPQGGEKGGWRKKKNIICCMFKYDIFKQRN